MCAPTIVGYVIAAGSDQIWYFAYGSNMQHETFVVRRGIRPSRSCSGRADGYALVFDLPVGKGERGVANLRAESSAITYGVLHRITSAELAELDRTEGVPQGLYDHHPIRILDAEGLSVEALTYVSRHRANGRKPSSRYLGLLIEGARQHALPEEYIKQLLAFPLAVDEREAPEAG